jgi:hypothetical protein
VSDHDGRFSAEQVPGVGTTFRLEFAACSDAIPPPAAPPDAPRRARGREMPEIPQVEAEARMTTAPATPEPTTTTAPETTTALTTTTAPAPEPSLTEPSLKND